MFSEELAPRLSFKRVHHRAARERAVQARYHTHPGTLVGASNVPRRAAPRSADLVLLTPLVTLRCSGDCRGRADPRTTLAAARLSTAQSHKASPSRRFMWCRRIAVHFRLVGLCIPRRFSTRPGAQWRRVHRRGPEHKGAPSSNRNMPREGQESSPMRSGGSNRRPRLQWRGLQSHHQMSAATPTRLGWKPLPSSATFASEEEACGAHRAWSGHGHRRA